MPSGNSFEVSPLDSSFGATVTGLQLAQIDDATFAKLYATWLEYALLVFPDHHPYTPRDWQAIVDAACLQNAACLVTTAKDAVRLDPAWPAPVPVYIVRIDVAMAPGEDSLQQQLQSLVSDANAR